MKQKDMIVIILVVICSGIFALVLSNLLISSPENRSQRVEVVDAISSDFKQPDSRFFNAQSNNPTKLILIGDTTNPQPFSGGN